MEREKAKEILSNRGWLSKLPEAARKEVLDRTVLTRFYKGEAIYRLQDPPDGMYGLVSGSVAITMAPGNSHPSTAHYGRPGFWFGERAVITGEPRRVGVLAHSDVAALHLPLSAITEMTNADPSFWRYLALNAALSLDLALRAYEEMKIPDARTRIAAILLRLAGFQTPSFAADDLCRIEITQVELGELAALSRQLVSRVLVCLSKEGLVTMGYAHIDLKNPNLLAGLVTQRLAE